MSTGDIVITKVYFPEGQTLSSQVKAYFYLPEGHIIIS
jgi:hypothetical protein